MYDYPVPGKNQAPADLTGLNGSGKLYVYTVPKIILTLSRLKNQSVRYCYGLKCILQHSHVETVFGDRIFKEAIKLNVAINVGCSSIWCVLTTRGNLNTKRHQSYADTEKRPCRDTVRMRPSVHQGESAQKKPNLSTP